MEIKVFIVDDEALARNTLVALLGKFCPNVTIVGTASELSSAVPEINKQKYIM